MSARGTQRTLSLVLCVNDSCQRARHRRGHRGGLWRLHSCLLWEDGVLEFLPAQGWEGLHGPTVCDTEPAIRAARAQGQALLTGALSLPFLSLEPEGPGREAWGLAGWVRACYPQADGCH